MVPLGENASKKGAPNENKTQMCSFVLWVFFRDVFVCVVIFDSFPHSRFYTYSLYKTKIFTFLSPKKVVRGPSPGPPFRGQNQLKVDKKSTQILA